MTKKITLQEARTIALDTLRQREVQYYPEPDLFSEQEALIAQLRGELAEKEQQLAASQREREESAARMAVISNQWAARSQALEDERDKLRQALAEAAMEIPTSGPVVDRIRVLKKEWSEHITTLEARVKELEATLENEEKVCTSLANQVDEWQGKFVHAEAERDRMVAAINEAEELLEEAGRPEGERLSTGIAAIVAERDHYKQQGEQWLKEREDLLETAQQSQEENARLTAALEGKK